MTTNDDPSGMTMTDWDHISRAILDEPEVDLHRLAAADWLDDHARADRVPCPRCSPYAGDPCPRCDGERRVPKRRRGGYTTQGLLEDCPACAGTGKFPPGCHPERDVASGRHEGGWTNCKSCNGGHGTPGFITQDDGCRLRAEFIRLQVMVCAASRDCPCGRSDRCHPSPPGLREGGICDAERLQVEVNGRLVDAADRCQEICVTGAAEGRPSLGKVWAGWPLNDQNAMPGALFSYCRGFVAEVSCTIDGWYEHGKQIVAAHPIEKVVLTDKYPIEMPGDMWAFIGVPMHAEPAHKHWLPMEIRRLLPDWPRCGFPSKSAAIDALSEALLKYARS